MKMLRHSKHKIKVPQQKACHQTSGGQIRALTQRRNIYQYFRVFANMEYEKEKKTAI